MTSVSVSKGERKLPLQTDVSSDEKFGGGHVFGKFFFFSVSCAIILAASLSESSLKGNECKLSDKNAGRFSDVSRLRVLIG